NNLQIRVANLNVDRARTLERSAVDLEKTALTISQDPTSGGGGDNSIGVSQNIAWPGYYKNQRLVYNQQTKVIEQSKNYTQTEVVRETRTAYYKYLVGLEKLNLLNLQDSIYRDFLKKSEIRFKVGETPNLELITARNKYQELQVLKEAALADVKIQQLNLQRILNLEEPVILEKEKLPILSVGVESSLDKSPLLDYYRQQITLSDAKLKLEKSKAMPDFTLGYSHQFVLKSFDPANINRDYFPGTRIAGLQFGISVPIFNRAGRARISGEKIGVELAELNLQQVQNQFKIEYE